MEEFVKLVAKAVEVYNRYRSPEAVATVIHLGGRLLTVRFKGSFCITCGVYDWFEDLGYELKTLDPNIEFKVTDVEQTGEFEFTVNFELKQALAET